MEKLFNARIFKEPYPGIFLGLLAVLVNVALWSSFYSDSYGVDGSKYHEIALSIYHGEFEFGYIVTPFFPALMAFIYLIGGIAIDNIYIANIIFFTATIVLLYYANRIIAKNTLISFIPVFMLVFYYPLLKMNFSVFMEIPTVFLLSIGLYFILKDYKQQKKSSLYAAVFSFSLLTMLNNRFVVLLGVYILFLQWQTLKENKAYKSRLIIPMLIVFIIIGPWFIYQGIKHKQLVIFTPTWHNNLSANFPFLGEIPIPENTKTASFIVRPKPVDYNIYVNDIIDTSAGKEMQLRLALFTEEKFNQMLSSVDTTQSMVWQRFNYYFTFYHNDFRFMYTTDYRMVNPSSLIQKYVQLFILLPIMILAFAGIALSIYRKHPAMILFGLFFFAHVFLHIITHFNARYRLTAMPIIVILAAYALSELFGKAKEWWLKYRQQKLTVKETLIN